MPILMIESIAGGSGKWRAYGKLNGRAYLQAAWQEGLRDLGENL